MNLKEGEKEIQKTVHLVIVLVVTGMAACLSVLTFVWNWELFSLPLFGVLTFVTWWLHVTETAPPRTRTLLYAAFVAFGIFFYGIHRDTFYDVAMLTIFSIAVKASITPFRLNFEASSPAPFILPLMSLRA